MPNHRTHRTTTPLSGSLRLLCAGLLLAAAVAAGALQRSPLIIASLALAFSAAFVVGRLAGWRQLAAQAAPPRVAASLLSVLLVQGVLVGLLYLLGAGATAIVRGGWSAQAFALPDLGGPLALGVACALLGLVVLRIEYAGVSARLDDLSDPRDADGTPGAGDAPQDGAELRLLAPVAPDTFYTGIHFSHARRGADGSYDPTPTEAAAGSDARIQAAEARLGISLPEGLRALYRVQNGGHASALCIPIRGDRTASRFDDVLTPLGGYDSLLPTERLTTAYDSFLAFADPEDEDDAPLFRNGTERMVVLAQWYRQTLFLDYGIAGGPGVGFVDFDRPDWPREVMRWPDFETFFAALRRYEPL